MKSFAGTMLDGVKGLFVSGDREKAPAEWKKELQESVNMLNLELRREMRKVEEAEGKAAKLKLDAVEANSEAERKRILQDLFVEVKKVKDAKIAAERYMRYIVTNEKNLSILSVSEALTSALGETVPFEALMAEMSKVGDKLEEMDDLLQQMEEQADEIDKAVNSTTSDMSTNADAVAVQELSQLIEKMKKETDPVKRTELERQYNLEMEKMQQC